MMSVQSHQTPSQGQGINRKKKSKEQQKKKRDPNVAIHYSLYSILRQLASSRDMPLTSFVSEQLEMMIRREQLLQKIKPFLSLESIGGNIMVIRDYREPDLVAPVLVRRREEKNESVLLRCQTDNSEDCVHVAFALGLLELGKIETSERDRQDHAYWKDLSRTLKNLYQIPDRSG